MQANSRPVTSSQTAIHDQLHSVVAKHAATEFLKPIAPYNRAAFDTSIAAWTAAGCRPLILDAGCGVGLSTLYLASQFPDHYVIGVDQSADRLARKTAWPTTLPGNFIRVRADLVDYWRLMRAAAIRPARYYVLYPNPWPKPGQLARRWHGHAVFPAVVALGGILERFQSDCTRRARGDLSAEQGALTRHGGAMARRRNAVPRAKRPG
ncbi:MAG: SAM-dependent methyltransferase [Burkholderia sp.]|nr:SAM-dependent methyltransferase [Burkholderia sp.]